MKRKLEENELTEVIDKHQRIQEEMETDLAIPLIDSTYYGRVTDVNKHGALIKLNGFRKEYKGQLHTSDSPLIRKLIIGNSVKVRIIACLSDGFISITTKDIDQPYNKVDYSLHKDAKRAFENQNRKIRSASPGRLEIKQFTGLSRSVEIEVINEEPRFLRNIASQIHSKIPKSVPVVKNELNFMALIAQQKTKNQQSSSPMFYFQQASFGYDWEKALSAQFNNLNISKASADVKTIRHEKLSKMPIKTQREYLPIYQYREEVIKSVTENQFLIVVGETGSGKTTQITQYLIEGGFIIKGKVACTQPRRVAAISVAKRVAEEYGCVTGQEVGYKIRFEDCTSPATIIKYMTDGILLRECLSDASLNAYSVVILDEAHERSIYTDILFGLLKEAVKRRPELRVIISSATLDAEKFSSFFNNAKILNIPGSMFPVEIFYRVNQEHNYFHAALSTVLNIHLREPDGDILLFLTGQDEIDEACDILEKEAKNSQFSKMKIIPMYSALPYNEQIDAFEKVPKGFRKVIVATNIAETSMTIDGIKFVIDPGYVKQKVFDPKTGIDALTILPISQASANQRTGRAGRTAPGKCYRIYTEKAFKEEMLTTTVPEIQRSNLANVVLHLKVIGIKNVLDFDFMDPPPRQSLIMALKQLYLLDALDENGDITATGRKIAQFPLDPNYAKMLTVSIDLKCSYEITTIIAMLSVPNIFYRSRKNKTQADEKKNNFNHAIGDHLRLLNVYEKWELNFYDSQWCRDNYLNEKKLNDAYDLREHLLSMLESRNIEVLKAGRNFERIQMAICAGFFEKIARKDVSIFRGNMKSYKTVDTQPETTHIHPASCLFHQLPDWVVYNEIRETTKKFLCDVTMINPEWLPIFAKGKYRAISESDNRELQALKQIIRQAANEFLYRY